MKKSMCIFLAAACCVPMARASVTYLIGNGGLGTFNGTIDGISLNGALAGGIKINKTAGGDASTPSSYTTICTDLEGSLYLGQSYTYNSTATPFTGQTGVNPTWGALNSPGELNANNNTINTLNAATAIQNAAYIFYQYGSLTSAGLGGDVDQKEAVQLAVWAALYDTGAGGTVDAGNGARFTFSGVDATVTADVSQWLSGLNGNYDYTGFLLYPNPVLGQNDYPGEDHQPPQELFVDVSPSLPNSHIVNAVPEAPTIIAGAMVLLPFLGSTVRILRRKSIAS